MEENLAVGVKRVEEMVDNSEMIRKKKRKNFLRLFTQTRPFKPKLGFKSLRCSVVLFSTFVLQLKKGVHKGRKNKKVFLNRKK